MAGASALDYVDSTVSPGTTYEYQIRATNVIGDSDYAGPVSVTTPAFTGAIDVYPFDALSGTTAVDSVGANNGTLVGNPLPSWVAGKIGAGALSFSGSGTTQATNQSAVQTANDLSPVLGATATLTAWIKTTHTGNDTLWAAPAITGVEAAGNNNDIRWGYIDASGHIGVGAGNIGIVSATAINDGNWHNVAFTRDAATGLCQVYIDGVLDASGTSETGDETSLFRLIGARSDVAGDGVTSQGATYFNGSLDDVRIYNQVLSAGDIQGIALLPGAPTLDTAAASPGPVVHLAWTTPSSYTQSIEVDRKTGAAGVYAPIATLGGGVTSYDDQTVVAGTQYFYAVKAIDLAGASPASNELSVTPPMPTIVANSIFYNGSAFDGFNGSSNQNDTISVATDKQALLPGETATFQNVTSYSKGINGVIVDVADFYNLPRFEDYTFQVSTDGATWAAAPTPSIINLYPGRGPNGSTQITLIWDDNVIENEWLQVTVLANDHTGLASDDVFYFGNLIGATGENATSTSVEVGPADVASIVADPHSPLDKASITDVNDINRDRQVNANDAILARDNAGATLTLITAPASGGGNAAPAAETSSPAAVALSPAPVAAMSDSPSPAVAPAIVHSAAISAPVLSDADSGAIVVTLGRPSLEVSPTPVATADSAPASENSSPPVVDQPPPQSPLERQAIIAAWESIDDVNHQRAWWSADRSAGTLDEGSDSAATAALDDVFASLSAARPPRH